ncbi:MAG: hypothetical protein ACYS3S_19485 [Planctomycetota bacterium]|jgi:hypothetical protein
MSFPFTYRGILTQKKEPRVVPIEKVAENIYEGLKKVKARNITINQNSVSFSGGLLRFVSSWNILGPVSSGEIILEENNDSISIHYNLKFTEILIIVTLMVAGFLGPFVWQFQNSSFFLKIMMLGFLWAWLFGMSYLATVLRFPSFIRKITSVN